MPASPNELDLSVQQLFKNIGGKFEHFKFREIKFAMSAMFSFNVKMEKFCVYHLWSNVSQYFIR